MATYWEAPLEDEYDPLGWVMQRERERKKLTYSCEDCGGKWHDEFLAKHHRCSDGVSAEEEFGGRCEDAPACGHEAGDCFGRKYGSDESLRSFWSDVYSSGMDDWEIDQLADRMDNGY